MSLSVKCYVFSGRVLCDGLITRPEESYRICVCVCVCVRVCARARVCVCVSLKVTRCNSKPLHLQLWTKVEKDLPNVWSWDRVVPYSGQAEQGIRKKLILQTRSGAHPTSSSMCTGDSFAGAWSDHAPPSFAEVRKVWNYRPTSTPTYFFMTCTCTTLSLLFLVCLTCKK
jgi:hypothetical protein